MSSRIDLLVVWPSGSNYIDEILKELRKFEHLELLFFKLYTPADMHGFIDLIYSVDTFPKEHLKEKNKYTYNMPGNSVYLLLVKNNNPQEKEVGEGDYKHLQSSYINDFKWKIRTKFNSYVGDEMTHQHIIHATDYESQTLTIWDKLLDVPKIDDLLARNTYFNYLPYYLANFVAGFKVCRVKVKDLKCSEARDDDNILIPFKESVFYKYTHGDKQPYIDYWNYFKGRRLQFDYTPSKFDEMIKNFDYQNLIVINGEGQVIDGNHRLAIYPDKEITVIQIPKTC